MSDVAALCWGTDGQRAAKLARADHQEAVVDVDADILSAPRMRTRYQQRAKLGFQHAQEPKPRHVSRKRTPQSAKLVSLQFLKYWDTDKYEWYRCWCLESPNVPYFQHRTIILQDYPGCERELEAVKKKGYKAKRTGWVGRGVSEEAVGPVPLGLVQGAAVTVEELGPPIPVRWQSSHTHCVPFAFLNVIGASTKQKKTLMRLLAGRNCGFRDLAPIVRKKPFKKNLCHTTITIQGILTKNTELYLVVDGVHCIGVDCSRQLIFDCAKQTALPLSKESY